MSDLSDIMNKLMSEWLKSSCNPEDFADRGCEKMMVVVRASMDKETPELLCGKLLTFISSRAMRSLKDADEMMIFTLADTLLRAVIEKSLRDIPAQTFIGIIEPEIRRVILTEFKQSIS